VILDDGKVIENERGGRQSSSPYFLRGLPIKALLRASRILKQGAETYEDDPFGDVTKRNWHLISSDEHLEHLLTHVLKVIDGDVSEEHAAHLVCRALFYLDRLIVERGETP
jgi:hypothetical protein